MSDQQQTTPAARQAERRRRLDQAVAALPDAAQEVYRAYRRPLEICGRAGDDFLNLQERFVADLSRLLAWALEQPRAEAVREERPAGGDHPRLEGAGG